MRIQSSRTGPPAHGQVTRDIMVKPTPAVKGMVPPEVHANLSWLDCKGAFVSGQHSNDKDADKLTMDFDEWQTCLALCGHIKYEEVEEMSLLQRVEAIFCNYFGEKDEHAIISAALYPPVERFDPSAAAASSEEGGFVREWAKMDLSHVFGFPVWEQGVFEIFNASSEELKSIYQMYAKSGTAGSASANAALTMQQTELQNLALDCQLSSEAFSMTRVMCVSWFRSADLALPARCSAARNRLHRSHSQRSGSRRVSAAISSSAPTRWTARSKRPQQTGA